MCHLLDVPCEARRVGCQEVCMVQREHDTHRVYRPAKRNQVYKKVDQVLKDQRKEDQR